MRVIVDANPYIFQLDIKERWVISFKLQPPLHPDKETPYQLHTRMEGGSRKLSEVLGKRKISCSCWKM